MPGPVELYLFDSGTLALRGAEVPVPFFLLRHPQGDVVVDGGNPLAVARDAHAHWGPLAEILVAHMSEEQHCASQLRAFGVEPSHIVQTHLHVDHTGALGHFPGATVIVHRRELEAARTAGPPIDSGYLRADYERSGLRWQPFDGDLDLFGDGTIRLLETPGHSAGHVSLLLELPNTGPVLLMADAVDNRAQWEGRAHPRGYVSREDAMRSVERLRAVAEETGAQLVFGHDPDNWSRLRRAPASYD